VPEPHQQPGENELFDVVIVGFAARDDSPEAGLKRVFGLDGPAARQLLESLPATVQHGVNRV
jgi:hypothetical protein